MLLAALLFRAPRGEVVAATQGTLKGPAAAAAGQRQGGGQAVTPVQLKDLKGEDCKGSAAPKPPKPPRRAPVQRSCAPSWPRGGV